VHFVEIGNKANIGTKVASCEKVSIYVS